jgi:hypothetical protein
MTRYAVSGTTSPDCTTEDTGEPAGTINGQPYWEWVVGSVTCRLYRLVVTPAVMSIVAIQGGVNIGAWSKPGTGITGIYTAIAPTTGNATVAVYVPPAYVTLQGETGFIVLRKST